MRVQDSETARAFIAPAHMGGGMSALKEERPLDPFQYLKPQVGRGPTIVQGLTDEAAPWLMLTTDVPWIQRRGPRALDLAMRSGDGTLILSFSAENANDVLQPTLFRDALGRLVAVITREELGEGGRPYAKHQAAPDVFLHGGQPRFEGQQPVFEREGCAFFRWARLQPVSQNPSDVLHPEAGGLGCFAVNQDGSSCSATPELTMRMHGRGGQNQKCVAGSGAQNEGLAIVSNEGTTFCFASGIDVVSVLASHIELSTYHRRRR